MVYGTGYINIRILQNMTSGVPQDVGSLSLRGLLGPRILELQGAPGGEFTREESMQALCKAYEGNYRFLQRES